jgi:hypothetical protein
MKKLIGIAALGLCLAGLSVPASADPLDCPPGQAATLNPADGGWVCINKADNPNLSEDSKKDKGYFAH